MSNTASFLKTKDKSKKIKVKKDKSVIILYYVSL